MKNLKFLQICLISTMLLGIVACNGGTTTTTATGTLTPLSTLPRISTQNQKFIDSNNQITYFRGMNLMSKTSTNLIDLGFNESDILFFKNNNNFNFVRLGVLWGYVEPDAPGLYDDYYLDQIESVIKMFAAKHVYVLVDFHQDQYSNDMGDGAPDWATITPESALATPDFGFPNNLMCGIVSDSLPCRTDINYAWNSFWENTIYNGIGLQERYANTIKYVVNKFKYLQGDIIGYEIMNEPWQGINFQDCVSILPNFSYTPTCPSFDQTLGKFYDKVITAISMTDPNTLIFYEPGVIFDYGQFLSPKITVSNHNLVFAYHNYGKTLEVKESIFANAQQVGNERNIPTFMDEFGTNNATESSLKEFIAMINLNNINNAYWAYFNNPRYTFSDGSGLPANPILQGLVYELGHPYGNNLNLNLFNSLKNIFLYQTSMNVTKAYITSNESDYNLTYTKESGQSNISLYVANGCSYNVYDMGILKPTIIKDNTQVIDTTSLENEGVLALVPLAPGC